MNWNEKYVFLFELYESYNAFNIKKHFETIMQLSKDSSPQIRSLVARICSQINSSEFLELLLKLSEDSNNLVKVEVADSLSTFKNDSAYQKLIELCNDANYMVRGYAEYGVGLVGNTRSRKKQSIEIISQMLKKEYRYFNRLQCRMALYFLGNEEELLTILELYHRLRYQDQCLVLHFLQDIVSENNKETITAFLSDLGKSGFKSVDCLVDQLRRIGDGLRGQGDGLREPF